MKNAAFYIYNADMIAAGINDFFLQRKSVRSFLIWYSKMAPE